MVSLRLQRIGRTKQPYFRLLAQDKRKDPHDRSLEILGSLNPRTKESEINKERIEYWLSVGAQPTARVHNLLIDLGIIKSDKVKTIKISKKRATKIAESSSVKATEDKEESKSEEVQDEKKGEKAEESNPVSSDVSQEKEDAQEEVSEDKKED